MLNGQPFSLLEDNASFHTSSITTTFLNTKSVHVINFPSISPDLNPIENIWGIMSNRIYRNGRRFNDLELLKIATEEEWNSLTVDEILNVSCPEEMKSRMFKVTREGGKTATDKMRESESSDEENIMEPVPSTSKKL